MERKSKRKFKHMIWDFDGDGEAHVIAKDECLKTEDLPKYLSEYEETCEKMEEGWCKFQVRSDWGGHYGERLGAYTVETCEDETKKGGKRKPGWFPVWIVRCTEGR